MRINTFSKCSHFSIPAFFCLSFCLSLQYSTDIYNLTQIALHISGSPSCLPKERRLLAFILIYKASHYCQLFAIIHRDEHYMQKTFVFWYIIRLLSILICQPLSTALPLLPGIHAEKEQQPPSLGFSLTQWIANNMQQLQGLC